MNHEIAISKSDLTNDDELVWQSFRRALVSQLHPKMIAAILLPFGIALIGSVILLWLFWTPLTSWMDNFVSSSGVFSTVDGWLVAIGLFSIKLWLVPLMAVAMLLPMAGVTGLVIAAIFIMPIVLRHLERRNYKGLQRKGENATVIGTWNAIWIGLLFCVGWLLTLPLWLFPPMALILPLFWWAFAVNRILRVDGMIEHASPLERKLLWRRHYKKLWIIGVILSLINLVPLFWLVMPVFSSLVYAHFCLASIQQLRAEKTIDGDYLAL